LALKQRGYQFVLSAWNMYELARSDNMQHIEQCCAFVDQLDPVWVSNNSDIKRQEVACFLQKKFGSLDGQLSRAVTPFNPTVAQMWATYGGLVLIGETFRDAVLAWRADPRNIEHVEQAANETPDAILTGRRAVKNGAMKQFKFIVDRKYFAGLVPAGTSPEHIDFLAEHIKDVLAESPAIAVEEMLNQIRLNDSFTPEPADAPDLQHALAPLAYCDYFVTDDKQLHEHCRIAVQKLRAKTQVIKSLEKIE
jgi:hypothetical protein